MKAPFRLGPNGLGDPVAGLSAEPIKQKKSAGKEWENSKKGIADRMRMSVNGSKNGDQKQRRNKTGKRSWD